GVWSKRKENPPPHAGSAYFSATDSPEAELQQDVDVRPAGRQIDQGRLSAVFTGYVRSFQHRPPDTGRIVIEYRDADNARVLDRFDTNPVASVDRWKRIDHSRVITKGARWIRVRLISVRHTGINNDGYYDSLSLKLR